MEGVTLIVINFDDMLLFLCGVLIYQVAKRLYKKRKRRQAIDEAMKQGVQIRLANTDRPKSKVPKR